MSNARRMSSQVVFGEGAERWQFPDPGHSLNSEARHAARHDQHRPLTQNERYQLAYMGDALAYLLYTCPTTELATAKLRELRRALRDLPDALEPPFGPPSEIGVCDEYV